MTASTTPLVSIVIPAFNAAPVIAETLASVAAQTFQNFEAIIVNDGSTDGTAAIVEKFCAADARFQLVSQPNAGLPATRNVGIGRTRGEFIAFLDDDDLWSPEKLARQLEDFRQDARVNFSFTNFYLWDGTRDLSLWHPPGRPLPEGDLSHELVRTCIFCLSSVMVRRDQLVAAGLFDAALREGCEDWDLWLRLCEHGLWARGLREPLVRYRRWPRNKSADKLKIAAAVVQMFEKNLLATTRPDLHPVYRRSLADARAKLELARARSWVDTAPAAIPAAIWRAWRLCPHRVEWLWWLALVAWPESLGGRGTARVVHRKLAAKW